MTTHVLPTVENSCQEVRAQVPEQSKTHIARMQYDQYVCDLLVGV